jgi:hypothetical protein
LINHALSTTPNTELGGFSPAELKFGTLDYSRFKLPEPLPPGSPYGDLVLQLDRNLATVRSITAAHQLELRETRQASAPTAIQNRYSPGDMLLWNPRETPTSLRHSKLAPKLLGPYTVINQTNNDISCRHVSTQQLRVFHTDRTMPFFGSSDSALKMGLLDQDEYFVAKILDHTGDLKRPTTLSFLVQWLGYDPNENTWEPWLLLKANAHLHAYLHHIGSSHLIPAKYR